MTTRLERHIGPTLSGVKRDDAIIIVGRRIGFWRVGGMRLEVGTSYESHCCDCPRDYRIYDKA